MRGFVAVLAVVGACARQVPPTPTPTGEVTMGPVSTDDVVAYTIALDDATTIEEAVALEVRMRVDSGANNAGPFSVLLTPTCARATLPETGFRCSARLPAAMVDRLNIVGRHEVFLAAYIAPSVSPAPPLPKYGESQRSSAWVVTTPDGPPPMPPPLAPVGSKFTKGCSGVPDEEPGVTCTDGGLAPAPSGR